MVPIYFYEIWTSKSSSFTVPFAKKFQKTKNEKKIKRAVPLYVCSDFFVQAQQGYPLWSFKTAMLKLPAIMNHTVSLFFQKSIDFHLLLI